MAQGSTARRPVGQQVIYLRTRLLGADGAGTRAIGTLPAGANVLRVLANVRTAFNGTPTLTLGVQAQLSSLATAVALGAVGHGAATLVPAGLQVDADTPIVGTVGGTPTVGVADIQIEYTVPDEVPS